MLVLNKPMGLAVQGGSGTTRHLDGMLEVLRDAHGQRPRLVHRLDKDTAGCLLVAKTRFAASALAKTFRSRSARKIYWALVAGVPKPRQGRISTFLAKEEREDDSFMRIARHGEEGASHAVTYYAVVETAARQLAWLSLKPVTGRTHQLRAHMAHIGHPIVGDPKYFSKENWELPGGMQNRLHLLARRIAVPHPRGGTIDVTAPLPPHMQQSWNLLGFDATALRSRSSRRRRNSVPGAWVRARVYPRRQRKTVIHDEFESGMQSACRREQWMAAVLSSLKSRSRPAMHWRRPAPNGHAGRARAGGLRWQSSWRRVRSEEADMSEPKFVPKTVYVSYIAATPEKVWDALTSASFTRQYLFGRAVEIEQKAGGSFILRMPDGRLDIKGRVMEWDPPRRLSVTWGVDWDRGVPGIAGVSGDLRRSSRWGRASS